jgi:ketosteroid isomerase-like protein
MMNTYRGVKPEPFLFALLAFTQLLPQARAEIGITSAAAAPPTEVAAIRAREADYTNGVRNKNVRLMSGVFADSFIDISATGHVINKQQYLEALKADRSVIESLAVDEEKITIYGDAAVATSRFVLKARDQDGKRADEVGRATDVWVKQDGKWMCVAVHSSIITE